MLRQVALLIAVLSSACFPESGNLGAVQQELVRQYGTPNVGTNLSNTGQLTVVFQNTPLTELDPTRQQAVALEVAEYIRDHYSGYAKLKGVGVAFGTSRRSGPIVVSNTPRHYVFQPGQLGPPVRPDT